jgi:hypothetical protein
MLVRCIKMPIGYIDMHVGVTVGLFTLLCMYQPMGISVWFTRASWDLLTQMSYTVSGDVGAHSGRVFMMRLGEIATGFRPIV